MPRMELERIDGLHVRLRLVRPEDAAYIHALRTDRRYNAFLSPVVGTIEDQAAWIADYKTREAKGEEYYYVIERCADGKSCGLVRMYRISLGSFTWGSWILDDNKPRKAALESAVLVYRVAFDLLHRKLAIFDVSRKNEKALHFHRRFGAIETAVDDLNYYFEYRRERFNADIDRHMKSIREVEG